MFDYLIKGGYLVDGTGAPGRLADIGIKDGLIAAIGKLAEPASETFNADGLVVCPGFIDPHTHYDAQLFWDPALQPSSLHGFTTVIAGNCGFTLAPVLPQNVDYVRHVLARVEGMSMEALVSGIPWTWSSFGDFLDRVEGRIGINMGFFVGHTALRAQAMGAEANKRPASETELAHMSRLLEDSIAAGGLGFSSSQLSTDFDDEGNPIASRLAAPAELIELCKAAGKGPAIGVEMIVDGCMRSFSDAEIDLLVSMSRAARRPLNWNLLNADASATQRIARQLELSERARRVGARIAALSMPVSAVQAESFLTYCPLHMLPDWSKVFELPVDERMRQLREPATRKWLFERANDPNAGAVGRYARFGLYTVGETMSKENEGFEGRKIEDIARQSGKTSFDTFVDIALADDLKTSFWAAPVDDDTTWANRRGLWDNEDVLVGGSDAGAHLDRHCGATYPTRFLGEMIRGRKLLPIERAIQKLSDAPARFFGLKGRGRIAPGYNADVVVFDPARIDTGRAALVNDIPGGSIRLTAEPVGIIQVMVNGKVAVKDGKPTPATAGKVLRSGRDTESTALRESPSRVR